MTIFKTELCPVSAIPSGCPAGQRIERLSERSLGWVALDRPLLTELGRDNLGVYIGRSPGLTETAALLSQLAGGWTGDHWVVLAAAQETAIRLHHDLPPDSTAQTGPKGPTIWTHGSIVFALPESLKGVTEVVRRLQSKVVGVIVLDFLCRVHRPVNFSTRRGRFKMNDRPHQIADFRAEHSQGTWQPPLLLWSKEPAKSVYTSSIAAVYGLEAFWFLDGRSIQIQPAMLHSSVLTSGPPPE